MMTCPKCSAACPAAHRFCHACGAELTPPVGDTLVGATLPGGYVIHELIAEGGMGRIYRAEQERLGRAVAVKIIHPHLSGDPKIAARFLVEARAASRLNHPNAVTVIAFGKMVTGAAYLVMQLLEGRSLSALAADGPLPLPRIVDIVKQALGALEQAHALAIVHRDFKPDNVIVERLRSGDDLVKVIDFGLAHLLSETSDDASSTTNAPAGTPFYMSPEAARGERVDGRSDLYSVGVVLYELLTGKLPFEAATTTQTLLAILNKEPMDPRARAPERNVPDSLAEAVMKALRKNKHDRFQTAEELSHALSEVVPVPTRYSRPPPPPSLSDPACPSCGTPILERRPFCGECGAALINRAVKRQG